MIDGNLVGLNAHLDRQEQETSLANWKDGELDNFIETSMLTLRAGKSVDTDCGVWTLAMFVEDYIETHQESPDLITSAFLNDSSLLVNHIEKELREWGFDADKAHQDMLDNRDCP